MYLKSHSRWLVLVLSIFVALGLVELFVLGLTPATAANVPGEESATTGLSISPDGSSILASVNQLQSPPGNPDSNNFIVSSDDNKNIYYYPTYGNGTIGEEEIIYSEPITSEKTFIGFAVGDYDRDGDNDFIAIDIEKKKWG